METISNSVLTVVSVSTELNYKVFRKMEKNTCGRETPVFGDAVHLFSFPSWGVCGKTLTAMRAILTGWGSTALPVIWISK